MSGRNSLPEAEAELIRRLQMGELAAFDTLFERHATRLLAYINGILQDKGLAEDVVQEAFVLLVRHIGRIRPEAGVAPWLFRVARNRAYDLLRHRRFESVEEEPRQRSDRAWAAPEAECDPATALLDKETQVQIMNGLNLLSLRDREVLMLRFYAGLDFKEMAAVLRRPLGTVLWQVHNALRRLKTHLEKQDTTNEK